MKDVRYGILKNGQLLSDGNAILFYSSFDEADSARLNDEEKIVQVNLEYDT